MPTYMKGDMWDVFGKTDFFLVTTNPIIKTDGSVVMGRGIAKQAKERFPSLPYDFGKRLKTRMNTEGADTNVGNIGKYDGQLIGWFMVKDHWQHNADPVIISKSVKMLINCITFKGFGGYYVPKDFRVDLNFPGIGNGKLKREDVLPLLEPLPENVHIWEYE